MPDKPTAPPPSKSSLLPRSMSLKRRKMTNQKRATSGAGGPSANAAGGLGGGGRRRNSDSVASERFKLPSWLLPPSGYKSRHASSGHRQASWSSSRRRKGDAALTDSEGSNVATSSTLRSTRSMRTLFSRPSTSTLSSTRSKHNHPFSPSLPPEIWVLIFQHATSPANPFLCSSALSSPSPSSDASDPDASPSEQLPSYSFLDFPQTQKHLLKEYRKSMRTKCTLTLVCKLWWAIGQEVLFEFVWLTKAREARLLAALLDEVSIRGVTPTEEVISISGPARQDETMKSKGWGKAKSTSVEGISVSTTTSVSYSSPSSHAQQPSTYTFPYDTRAVGRHIRRLHIETHSLDRCSPQDLLTILRHAPALQVFSDNQSIRRTSGFSVLSSSSSSWGSSTVISAGAESDGERNSVVSSSISSSGSMTTSVSELSAPSSPSALSSRTRADSHLSQREPQHQQESDMQLLSALMRPQTRTTSLRRLSWTSYEYEAGDFEAGMAFYTRVLGPKLRMVSAHLEYLELTLCVKDLVRGMTGQGGTGGGFFESLLGAGNFTSSTITTTTTVTSDEPSKEKSLSHSLSTETLRSIQSVVGALTLPNLTSIKLTLDNVTCLVVSTWELPRLKNVSLIASDFSYAHEGFASFFEVHGGKINELELGHSTGAIQEFWVTAPPPPAAVPGAATTTTTTTTGWRFGSTRVPLAEWCPNLKTFICSADAEWNWENPDWIAPHVLLPAHPTLEVIGVRDIEKRVYEALGRAEYRDRVAVSEGRGLEGLDELGGVVNQNDPFFALLEQLGSLVKSEAFPALKYVRDLSPDSRGMRGLGRVRVGDVEMRSMGSWDLRDDEDEDEEESEVEEVGGPTSNGYEMSHHGRAGYSTFGQGGLVALWSAMVQNMSPTPPLASPATRLRSSTDPSKPTGKTLQRLLERQQGLRVLRFWKNVLALFSLRGVCLEDCDGYEVTLERLRRAAVGDGVKV